MEVLVREADEQQMHCCSVYCVVCDTSVSPEVVSSHRIPIGCLV